MNPRRPASEAQSRRSRNAGSSAFYGAPCLILLAIDPALSQAYACVDAGLFAQTLCLAAEDRGFATCIMSMAVRFPEILHAEIPGSESMLFVLGIAMGLSDHLAVANRGERNRVGTAEFVTFVGD